MYCFMFQPLLFVVFSVKKYHNIYHNRKRKTMNVLKVNGRIFGNKKLLFVFGLAETDEICLYRVAIFLDLDP